MAAAPQNPNQAIDAMTAMTTAHLVLMALLAAAAVLIIWYGSVLYFRRKRAAEQVQENYEAAEAHGAVSEPVTTLPDATPALSADVPQPQDPAAGPAIASDLTQIKGLGPKLATTLGDLGVTRVAQIAALSPTEAAALDARLGTFQGRMARDRWVEQARLLAAGDRAGYEAAFGKLGG